MHNSWQLYYIVMSTSRNNGSLSDCAAHKWSNE